MHFYISDFLFRLKVKYEINFQSIFYYFIHLSLASFFNAFAYLFFFPFLFFNSKFFLSSSLRSFYL
jgi:hypothetical protein